MKLRVSGNSLRLRLSRTEVARFAETGRVDETLDFGVSKFQYALESSDSAAAPQATYGNGRLTVAIPRAAAREWTASDSVGISASQPASNGNTLEIVIEKDFQCMHDAAKSDPDAFPNPMAANSPAR